MCVLLEVREQLPLCHSSHVDLVSKFSLQNQSVIPEWVWYLQRWKFDFFSCLHLTQDYILLIIFWLIY